MNIQDQAMKALDVLENADVMHEFDDHVLLRVDADIWKEFIGEEQDA